MTQRAADGPEQATSRREFLKGVAGAIGGFALSGGVGEVFASTMPAAVRASSGPAASGWADQIGLELYTVRDLMAKDYLGTLEKVAQIGYKEVEPATGYNDMPAKKLRAELDRLGLRMPSTHSGITAGPTAPVEKQLADFQVLGIEYTALREPRPSGGGGLAFERRAAEDVKREAALYNQYGKIAQRFGIKLLRHNHTVEFLPLQGSDEVPYTILLEETDPELVAMQMDIGWAVVAGQDPVRWFERYPGRFVLWHVKDAACLQCLPPVPDQEGRMAHARLVPVGNGEIDYGEIFKHADVAGMKHFVAEQDSAADWGDSLAAARVSYEHLHATLTGQS